MLRTSPVPPLYAKAEGLTEKIIAGAIEDHRNKGPGLLESIYECYFGIWLFPRAIANSCSNNWAGSRL